MNLLKKVAATASLVVLASSLVVSNASAYSQNELAAANTLAAKGIINDHSSNPAGYALDQFVLRQEIAAVARGIAGIPKKTTCDNEFTDVSATNPNTWACYTVEALRDAGKIAANPQFRPEDNITKAEALGMVVKAACDDQYMYDPSKGTTWQEQVRDFAVTKGIIATFSDFNALATRGFAFEAGANAMTACKEEVSTPEVPEKDAFQDLLCKLDPSECQTETPSDDNGGEETPADNNGGETTTGSTETPSDDNGGEETPATTSNTVALASDTPAAATIPGGVTGVPVAKFVFTAGSEDLTINTLVLKRRGLSDKDTLTGLAAFTDEGRVSHAKNDSQENDTEATLTLLNGGVVVPAGTSKTITIVADVASKTVANGDEFAIELKSVQASSEVEGTPVVANTMKVGGVDAATLQVEDDSDPSNVKAGQSDVDIVKFKLKGDNNSDIIVKSITLKGEGTVDEEDEIVNYKLKNGNTVLAEVAKANGKYVTFNLSEPFTVKEDKTERFTVTADIIGGAGKTIAFKIDKNLDITAEDTQYGYGANITGTIGTAFSTIKIDAGELTLDKINPSSDKIREDKNNVELGKLKVTNVAGKNLELQKLSVKVVSTGAGVENILENFEAVINGTSYELTQVGTGTTVYFSDDDLTITIPQGITEITFRADTKENLNAGDKITVSLSTPKDTVADGIFYVVETEDDTQVTDLTPSSLSFKTLEVINAGATASANLGADLTVVKDTKDVLAGSFHIKADEASALTIDNIKVKVTASGAAATNNEISEVALYKGSVSDANLLDRISGSNLDSNGIADFNGFNVTIDADDSEDFIVTVSVDDGAVAKSPIKVQLTEVVAQDDDGDDVTVSGLPVNALAKITVTDSGKLFVEGDIHNTDNEAKKLVLAGNSEIVYSVDIRAKNEEVEIEKITFEYTGTGISKVVDNATLYLDNVEIATNSHSDITEGANGTGTIVFDNLTNLAIPTDVAELKIKLNTLPIGENNKGKAIVLNARFDNVVVNEATGKESDQDLTSTDITTNVNSSDSNLFSIVPSVVTPSITDTFGEGDNLAVIKMDVQTGDNKTADGNGITTKLDKLRFEITSLTSTGTITIKNGTSDVIGSGTITGNGVVEINVTDDVISENEQYSVQVTAEAAYSLLKDGVIYNADGKTYSSAKTANDDMGNYDKN